jgi:phytoene dehydrogenase-like protein
VRWRYSTALDTVRERFEDERVRTFFLWLSLMTMARVDRPGTGLLPLSIAAGRQAFSWTTAEGGSVALPDALARIVVEHGGAVRTGAEVTRILIEDGRAVGAVTADGTEHRAKRAVVSTIHVKHLPDVVGAAALGEDFMKGLSRWRTGITMFVTHYALTAAPRYALDGGPTASVAAGICGSTDELLAALAAFERGEIHLDRPPLLCISSSVVDATRAPAGHHTLKVVGFLPYELRDGGPERWDTLKGEVSEALLEHYLRHTTLRREDILARHIESPLDLERRNPHNYRGSCHGGEQDLAQEGALRPMPRWAGYRLPVAGLYQTGATTHPGASVTGAPGRNCAQVLLEDLGLSLSDAIAGRVAPARA